VDLVPALQLLLGALAGLQRGCPGPAAAVRGDFLLDSFGQAVPQMPAVADLDRAGQCPADRLTVCLYWSKIRLLVLSWAFMLSAGIR
jgi:hypothetical protein